MLSREPSLFLKDDYELKETMFTIKFWFNFFSELFVSDGNKF